MPRMPRIYVEQGLYYVVAKGNYGGNIFKDDEDCQEYLRLLARYKDQHQFKLFAYYLTQSSVILLIQTDSGGIISDIMRDLNSNYTKYFNGRYNKKGHLFQGRFRDILVEKEKYLEELTRYIHFLPVAENLVEKPQAYKWSSYRLYLGLGKQYGLPLDIDRKEVLERFSANAQKQVELYKGFIESTQAANIQAMKKKLQEVKILGSKDFTNEARKKAKEAARSEEPLAKGNKQRVFVVAGSVTILILGIFTVYSYRANLRFRENIEQTLQENEGIFEEKLVQQREIARKDLEEKYRADKVSYRAMSRRLEIEREKDKELEGKLKDIK